MKEYQYRAIHIAVATVWGKPISCEICKGKNDSKRYEWSNKEHTYQLNRDDWQMLCATCHRRYDRNKFGHKTWNKGLIGRQSWHNTEGLGQAWNKGRTMTKVERSVFRKKYRITRAITGKHPYLLENGLMKGKDER